MAKQREQREVLTERICLRLVDLAQDMGKEKSYQNLPEFFALTKDSFTVFYDVEGKKNRKKHEEILSFIEDTVNANTHPTAKAVHGQMEFGENFLDMFHDPTVLVTFAPDTCTDVKQRYAALMVAQRFETELDCLKGKGLPYCAGVDVPHRYGLISYPHLHGFAVTVNSILGEHAFLPIGEIPMTEGPEVYLSRKKAGLKGMQ